MAHSRVLAKSKATSYKVLTKVSAVASCNIVSLARNSPCCEQVQYLKIKHGNFDLLLCAGAEIAIFS